MDKNSAILCAAVMLALLFGCVQGPGAAAGGGSGASTLAISEFKYITNDAQYATAYTILEAVDGSSGKQAVTLSPDQILQLTGTVRTPGPVYLETNLVNQTCRYSLKNDSIPVYTYSWVPTYYNQYSNCDCQVIISSGCTAVCTSGTCGYNPHVCAGITRTKVGDIYPIDSVAHYDSQMQISLGDLGIIALSPLVKNGEIAGVMRASFVGSWQGDQSCPVPSTDTVLFRPLNTNQLLPKSSYYVSTIIQQNAIPPTPEMGIEGYNSIEQNFISSNPSQSSYCSNVNYSGPSTTYSCTPTSSVAVPAVRLIVNANLVGVVLPSGQPKIISVSGGTASPGQTVNLAVTVQNIGNDSDSFDVSLTGPVALSFASARLNLSAGATGTANIQLQGAGVIGNYTVRAASVNAPLNTDSASARIEIEPFCDREPEPGKTRVATEYGCYWVCTGTNDMREKTCQPFGTFEPRGIPYSRVYQSGQTSIDADCSQINTPSICVAIPICGYSQSVGCYAKDPLNPHYVGNIPQLTDKDYSNEYHCIGVAAYMTLNDYMDKVSDGNAPFLPAQKQNAYWLGAPVCNYAAAFGYHWDGAQAVIVQEKVYAGGESPTQGSLSDYFPPVNQTQNQTQNGTGGGIVITPPPSGDQSPIVIFEVLLAFAAAIVIGLYYLTRDR